MQLLKQVQESNWEFNLHEEFLIPNSEPSSNKGQEIERTMPLLIDNYNDSELSQHYLKI